MADSTPALESIVNEPQEDVSSTWFFMKITGAVTLALAILIFALSPQLYTGINKDTPEYWAQKARNYVEQKDYEKAIEAYTKVLSFEPDREKIFTQASQQIKSLQQLQSRREKAKEEAEEEDEEEAEEEEEGQEQEAQSQANDEEADEDENATEESEDETQPKPQQNNAGGEEKEQTDDQDQTTETDRSQEQDTEAEDSDSPDVDDPSLLP